MVSSWIWELKRWMQRQQKNAADQYSNRVVELITAAQQVSSIPELDKIWQKLLTILREAVHDLDTDKLSEESFNSFRIIAPDWNGSYTRSPHSHCCFQLDSAFFESSGAS